ncbi:MAG: asparagine synthase (glutamine-hydrolyzing), partial [Myxococcales bacterium]|nr:asparagine synthase (glutamine-hydrolyzing) [Myxococcales bacterium]
MCGIAGVFTRDGSTPDREVVLAMTRALAHRGPDEEGAHAESGVGLGNRRLVVLAPEAGGQPMSDPRQQVWISFNGEVYNHDDLRSELTAGGYVFRGRSDTEVALASYMAWGESAFSRFEGMFSVALWDGRSHVGILARDRMGQKPLYYAALGSGDLVFASELRALRCHPAFVPAVSDAGLAYYLTYEYLPGDLSILSGVQKLRPGHFLRFERGEQRTQLYWDIPFRSLDMELGEAASQLDSRLNDAVARRLRADVPVGVLLSGGIDSSTIAALAVANHKGEPLHSFCIGFDDPSFDESEAAAVVASHLGLRHHTRHFSDADALGALSEVGAALDEPLGDASLLATYALSRLARETVVVALGGDGADELLMGYPTFRADPVARAYARMPQWFRRTIARQVARVPVDSRNFSPEFVVKSFLDGAGTSCDR